jgi:hypothetical protein
MRTLLVTAVLGGCVISSGTEGMHDALHEARSEEQVHVRQSRAAPDLPSLVIEIDRYSAHMTAIFDDMSVHMSAMHDCPNMGMLWNDRDQMQVEVDDLQITMHHMGDLTLARAEDEHHITVMSGMLDNMHMQLDSMHCGW